MVRVNNIFGDITTGKSGEAVYQRKYGRGMRRLYKEVKPSSSPGQIEQNENFKKTIAWIKTLTAQEKQAVKKYCREKKIGNKIGEPIHWYNWLKSLGLKKARIRLIDEENMRYRIEHNAIFSVREIDSFGKVKVEIDGLSDLLDSRYLDVFEYDKKYADSILEVTTLPGIKYMVGEVVEAVEMLYFDSEYFDGEFFV